MSDVSNATDASIEQEERGGVADIGFVQFEGGSMSRWYVVRDKSRAVLAAIGEPTSLALQPHSPGDHVTKTRRRRRVAIKAASPRQTGPQPLSMAPPDELAQHAIVRKRGHLAFERQTRARHLGPPKWGGTGDISLAELLACERFERACVRADGCLMTDERKSAAAEPPTPENGIVQAQINARQEVRQIEAGIGAVTVALLRLAIVEDVTWAILARHCERSADTARRLVLAAIKDLAEWYQARDSRP